ncbi:hypothetical protein ASPSYDRAFT_935795 [Aspergillus sydowii CBS 593.65]|uniref:Uncharacterized protein n=1 Tax=Aspergillus sydowii CBS 593.65 TaxID=1036612 RepID=A0A1L9TLG1_9EURO|nr:uncharacterized protein ASPSYDRAFT_935795 [Aspergillus sydowii CBS 593.65]OJJ60266.1 hypothetical protein ASPSYDRAFT_935795 [Aspergillus sydowii CBS 593.65]
MPLYIETLLACRHLPQSSTQSFQSSNCGSSIDRVCSVSAQTTSANLSWIWRSRSSANCDQTGSRASTRHRHIRVGIQNPIVISNVLTPSLTMNRARCSTTSRDFGASRSARWVRTGRVPDASIPIHCELSIWSMRGYKAR